MSDAGPILVAGGGIGGLAAALALAQSGSRVRVIERAREFREVGAGIQLGPNVFAMLDRLGLRKAVEATAVIPDALVMRCALRGSEIARVPLGEGFNARFGNPYAVIHRADLHAALLEACRANPEIELTTNCTILDVMQDGDGVTVRIENGSKLRGRGLVGADGLWSHIRAMVMADGPSRPAGHVAYRAVLPMEQVPIEFRRREVMLWAGPGRHLVQHPLRRGELMDFVAVFESGHGGEGWDRAGDAEELRRHFRMVRPELLDLITKITNWRFWSLHDRDPRRGWTKGRVTLLGDAAHPMLLYLSQGAGMAIEDAVCLADQVALQGDVAAAFAAYEAHRILRTGRVQVTSRFFGEICHAEGVRAELRDAMLGGVAPAAAWEAMAWLYTTPDWPRP